MNKQKTKYHLRERKFLNRFPDLPAFVIGIVEDTTAIPDENEDGWKWSEIELTIADCNRRITLSFDLGSARERANSLCKIRRLAKTINAFHAALECEAATAAKRKIVRPKKQKTKT